MRNVKQIIWANKHIIFGFLMRLLYLCVILLGLLGAGVI